MRSIAHRIRGYISARWLLPGLGVLAWLLLSGCAALSQTQASAEQRRAAEVNAELGISYLRQEELAQAERALDRALRFDPGLALAQLGMASLRERQGLPDAAVQYYRRALELEPENHFVQTNLGDLLCREGHLEEGQRLLDRAGRNTLNPARQAALTALGNCYTAGGDSQRGEELFRQALRLDPHYAPALWELAVLAYSEQRFLQARAFLSRIKALGIESPESLLLCYQVELQMRNLEDALTCAERLRNHHADSDEAAQLMHLEQVSG